MDLANIPLTQIRPPKYLLRPVKKSGIEYQEMLDSIREHGLWQPILVRPLDSGEFEVVEGSWRYTCCKQLRLKTIPCIIRNLTDEQVLIAQLQANGIRPETSPVDFSERLALFLQRNPDMTVPKLARIICKSPTWIGKILQLRRLRAEHGQLVRRGEIPLESACALARLPRNYHEVFIPQARILSTREFVKLARAELKRIRETSRNSYIDAHKVNQDKPVPYFRKIPAIRSEFSSPVVAGSILLKTNAKTPLEGWKACLAWILHMDPESLEEQKQMIVARHEKQRRAEERRKLERQKLRELREQAGENNISTLELET